MTDGPLSVASYLAGLPEHAWGDLHELAGDLLARFPDMGRAELERGIAISLEILKARIAERRTASQDRIAAALAESGPAGAAALILAEWDSHAARSRGTAP